MIGAGRHRSNFAIDVRSGSPAQLNIAVLVESGARINLTAHGEISNINFGGLGSPQFGVVAAQPSRR